MALNVRKQDKMVLSRLSILLYGFPKIGKTTEAAKLPGALILSCEPGGTDLLKDIEVMDVHNLSEFERAVDEIARSNYKAIVVDGFTWMVNQAAKQETNRPGQNGRQPDGRRVYQAITDRVTTAMSKLLDSGKVVIATGHSRLVDSTEGTKDKKDVRPDLNEALADDIFGVFSIICYCYPTQGGSKMLTKPSDNDARRIYAGDRSGVLPATMPLDLRKVLDLLKAAAGEDKPATPVANGAAKPVAMTQPAEIAAVVEPNGDTVQDTESDEQPTGDNPFISQHAGAASKADLPYDEIADALTGDCRKLATWAAGLHANSDGPATKPQYGFLATTVDKATGDAHTVVLSVLCRRYINAENPCGKEMATKLLNYILPEVAQNDANGKPVKVDGKTVYVQNTQYRPDYAECLKSIAQAIQAWRGNPVAA